ncbi:MAG: GGDEF domain-containing protein [Thermoguttaceae bacterium]
MSGIGLFGLMDLLPVNMPTTVALALVALLGYLFGQRTRRMPANTDADEARRKLQRAEGIARELERIAETVRKNLAKHHASVAAFRSRVTSLSDEKSEDAWVKLGDEVEGMLQPTLRLATQISAAYDQIRRQSTQLLAFTGARADSLTGLNDRQGLDDSLKYMFAMLNRYNQRFSLAIFDIDNFKTLNDDHGHLHGDVTIQQVARLLSDSVRETDFIARFGGEEFVVVLPQTTLGGACDFAERYRSLVAEELSITVSGGIAAAVAGDTPNSLLARADSALYGAKAAGRNLVFCHDGAEIRPPKTEAATISVP